MFLLPKFSLLFRESDSPAGDCDNKLAAGRTAETCFGLASSKDPLQNSHRLPVGTASTPELQVHTCLVCSVHICVLDKDILAPLGFGFVKKKKCSFNSQALHIYSAKTLKSMSKATSVTLIQNRDS